MDNYLLRLNLGDAKYQTSLVYGVRGSGKTVFLLNVQRNFEKEKKHFFVRLNLGQGNLLFQLLSNLQEISGTNWSEILKSVQEINISGNGVSFQDTQNDVPINYSVVLQKILTKFKAKGISILVGIDEIEVSDDIRSFVSVYQTLIRQDLDISLIMTGLPSRISELQHEKTLTFLLRSNRIYLKPLDKISIRENYASAFEKSGKKIDPLLLDRLVDSVKGYAYAFQTIGYYVWDESEDYIDSSVVNSALESAKNDLYKNAYEKLYTEVSDKDRELLDVIASAKKEKVPISFLLDKFDNRKNYLSVYRARLLDDRLIFVPERGYVSLALPFLLILLYGIKKDICLINIIMAKIKTLSIWITFFVPIFIQK
ncbi:ATP-binding protein [Lactobacillus helveticus]|uniref:hypothetical protein n=1 Tax=Lactobacillus helveticus TaxID=1587 RepID=UPI001D1132DC|nr:hypothetical protein [Lactobacillus helveticus]